ncbi:uncharacterized protein LY89DRAFT_759013 [Mollisia scopiformis]|uniref:Uncharacterized protein n=1 Tax=Mollisia scopiformis TaxID=149040 RepID=A0A194WTB8_MOLSC|nr:uncharacterized protein LY89DRAFT_759013 [Mollisia scopiformis]KUJ11201.1 hypothetical protein LY89DRAFT_759013 [Mollisia scopiformis]
MKRSPCPTILVIGPSLVSASTFATNCTIPSLTTTIVTAPNSRGTLQILWSSLFTIFICIWTVQHLNVPGQRDGRDKNWRGDLKWAWKRFWTKFKWMLFSLIFPEFLLAKAVADWMAAKNTLKIERAYEDPLEWTLAHAFYINMGGFVTRSALRRNDLQGSKLLHLDITHVEIFRLLSYIKKLPITKEEVEDKSKADSLVKASAIAQVAWMVIQVAARTIEGLPVTQMEITACSFAACCFITYMFWWNKPKNINEATDLGLNWVEISERRTSSIVSMRILQIMLMYEWSSMAHINMSLYDQPPRNDSLLRTQRDEHRTQFYFSQGLMFGGIVLGATQCAAWKLDFPTKVDRDIWRFASIASASVVILFYALSLQEINSRWPDAVDRNLSKRKSPIFVVLSLLCGLIYTVCRMFILFESVYSLFHLSPEAFKTTWSTNLPHVN